MSDWFNIYSSGLPLHTMLAPFQNRFETLKPTSEIFKYDTDTGFELFWLKGNGFKTFIFYVSRFPSWNPTNVRNTLRQHPQPLLPSDMNPSRIPACCAVSETSKIFGIGPVLVELLYV